MVRERCTVVSFCLIRKTTEPPNGHCKKLFGPTCVTLQSFLHYLAICFLLIQNTFRYLELLSSFHSFLATTLRIKCTTSLASPPVFCSCQGHSSWELLETHCSCIFLPAGQRLKSCSELKQSNCFSLYLLVAAKKKASEIDMATRPVMLKENIGARLVTKVPS